MFPSSMPKTLLFVADPPAALNPKGDSSLALAEAALELGFAVDWTTPSELSLCDHRILVDPVASLRGWDPTTKSPLWDSSASKNSQGILDYRAVLIRKDPPFDSNYTSFCWLLDLAFTQPHGVTSSCYNAPQALLSYHEKALQFAALSAGVLSDDDIIPAVVTTKPSHARAALERWSQSGSHDGYIIKPWLGYGGRGVHFAPDPKTAFEVWVAETQNATQILQPFDPLIHVSGDVRVILARDKIIGCFARKPMAGKVASNLAQGGSAHPYELSPRQQDLMQRVAGFLLSKGIVFAGVDLIGDRINEINITSPTGLRSLQQLGVPDAHRQALRTILELK